MTIQAQSADGMIHEFPDGTNPSVIDGAMKAYAAERVTTAKPAPKRLSDATLGDLATAIVKAPGQIAGNFRDDYLSREKAARDAVVADATGKNALAGTVAKGVRDTFGDNPVSSVLAGHAGRMVGGAMAAADTVNWLASPFLAAGDQIVGRPAEIASGGRLPHQQVTDVVSALAPIGEGVAAERALAKAADAAGMSIPAYQKMVATRAQTQNALAATAKAQQTAAKPPGAIENATAPFKARFSDKAAQQQAGNVLASRATDVTAVKNALADGPREIVPGSVPTTFQQAGDMGLGSLEREQATKNPADFNQRRADQNTARVNALGAIQSGGDAGDVAKTFRQHLDDLDASTQAAVDTTQKAADAHVAATDATTQAGVDTATSGAQARAQGIGGHGTPEGYGEQLRGGLSQAEQAAKAHEGKLWQAVDPNGDLTGNVTQTATAAKQIRGEVPPTAKPMDGEEGAIFDAATALPPVAPVRDLIALRGRVSDAMREELRTNGSSQVYRRLTQLRGAIQDNLSTSIADQASVDDAAVKAGTMPAEAALSAKVRAFVDEWKQERAAARGNAGGVDLGNSRAGTVGVSGPDGAASDARGGPGAVAGNPGVPDAPTFDQDAAGRLAVATEATKARARTFGLGPVGNVLQKAGPSDVFRLPDGQVPGKFFHPGPAAFEHVQAALKASPDALPVLQDHAALTLRREAMTPDGLVDPAKFARWQAKYTDALRALPAETRARFADAAEAGRAVAEAGVARADALKAAQTKAAEDVAAAVAARKAAMQTATRSPMGRVSTLSEPQDITRTVGSILNGRTAVADMREMATAARKDPNAFAGLRQAVADHIMGRFIGNTEAATSGTSSLKADQFQTFVRQNQAALSQVFSPEEIKNLQAIAADIQRAKRSENAIKLPGGSNTPQDILAAAKTGPTKGARTVLNTIATALGFVMHGPVGAVGTALGADFVQGLRAGGVDRVDQLVTRAMLDPALAKTLLEKMPEPTTPAARTIQKGKLRMVLRALSVGAATDAPRPTGDQPAP